MLGTIYLPELYFSLKENFPEAEFRLNTIQITTLLYRSIVKAYPDIVGIPVMPSIEQRIGVIWKKGKNQNATTEKVIKFIYSSQSLIAPGGQTSVQDPQC